MTARLLIVLAIAAVLCGAPSSASAAGPNGLSAPQSSPASGTTATSFSFTVTYTGGSAALAVTVDIAGRVLPMVLITGDPTSGTWFATTMLPVGSWSPTFRAVASQGKNPSIVGPTVTVGAPATPRPTTPNPTITAPAPRSAQPEASNEGGPGSGSTPPPAAPVSTVPPAVPGGPGETTAPPEPVGSAPVAPAPAASTAEAPDTDLSDGATVSTAPETGGRSGVGGSGQSAASASRPPSSAPAADTTSIPTEGQIGPLELVLGLGGVTALALFAWFILLAGRRRADVRVAGATAEEQVTATLHRRTLRRSKMRHDEDPIVAALGVGASDAGPPAHPARRASRRSPPT
ncbi:MAG: hypothetical protein ABIZ57_03250 [Candidatus Limnocylindria bacterium]